METNWWWGYLHENDSLQLKRYWDIRDIQDARESPFCRYIYGPFKARNRAHATEKIIKLNKIRLLRFQTGVSIKFAMKALVNSDWEISKAYAWCGRYGSKI